MSKNKKILLICIILILAIGIAGLFYYGVFSKKNTSNTSTYFQPKKQTTSQPNKSTTTPSVSNPTSGQSSATAKNYSNTQPVSGTQLETPFGQFVSDQNPSLSNSSQQFEESICETTSGATCYIEFVKAGSSTITLPAQTTNSQGVTSWDWYLNKEGFTPGTWQITAVATLGSQTKSASESMTVQP